jgi:hypothetical protein
MRSVVFRSSAGLPSVSQVQRQPGAHDQQTGARAGQRWQELLERHYSHVSDHDHLLLDPRCEAVASERAASKGVASSYSSWRFHHT